MEPFSIQCDSCRASLKVAKATLIGKKLPCPKCQAWIVVPAGPQTLDGHQNVAIPTAEARPATNESPAGFDDVDDLLSQLPVNKQQPPQHSKRAKRVIEPPANAEPITPELSWDNPAATQTRRVLAWAAAAMGAILFIAIGCYWWLNRPPTQPPAVTPIDQEVASAEEGAPADSASTESGEPDSNDLEPPPIERQADAQRPEATFLASDEITPTEVDEAPVTSDRPVVTSTPPQIDIDDTIPTDQSNDGLVTTSPVLKPSPSTPSAPDTATALETAPPKTRAPADGILQPVAPAKSALSELSSLLEESGSSISAITDATTNVAVADLVGLPKYYFREARSAPVDIERQLKQPCAGLRYRDIPLVDVLRDVTVISGIPITIDTASTIDHGNRERLIPKVSVDISDTDFRDAIEQIAGQVGWTSQTTETGIVLAAPDAGSVVEKTIDLAPIADLGDQGLDGVVDGVKAMIARETWFSNSPRFAISRSGMVLTVKHVPAVVKRVERFVNKISAAIKLSEGNSRGDDSLQQAVATRLSLAQPNLSASCELDIDSRSTLDHLLNRIRAKTGVDVIANWETLATLGWTPLMTVPGNISEPTLDQMLRQLERSTDSTSVVLDAHTVELTTPIDAMQRSYIEFYVIADLFKQNFTPQRTLQLVQEAIENAAQPAASTTIYEPRCRCIILAAPQSTHRVVETVLLELRQLK